MLVDRMKIAFGNRKKTVKSLRFKLSCVAVLAALLALSANLAAAVTMQPESFFTHLHTEKAMANVTVSPGRAGPVVITIQLETADELPLEAKSVSVTLTNPGTASQVAQAERTDDNQWQARMSAPSPGRWMLGLGISISDTDRVDIESPIMIR
jgi:hypothetical protein